MQALPLKVTLVFTEEDPSQRAATSFVVATTDLMACQNDLGAMLSATKALSALSLVEYNITQTFIQPGIALPPIPGTAVENNALVLVFNTAANTLGAVALPYCNFILGPCDPLPSVAQPLVDHLLLLGGNEAGAAFTSLQSAFTQRDFEFSYLRRG